jgi:predicted Zn-dependent peptidase
VAKGRLRTAFAWWTVETPHLHAAAAGLYVRTGSRYETARTNGLSHFVEHMLFRGSAGFPTSFALNRAIEERCGMLCGETGRDYSLYQVQFHPREMAMFAHSSAIFSPRRSSRTSSSNAPSFSKKFSRTSTSAASA